MIACPGQFSRYRPTHPRPSHSAIAELERKYLGPVRRAGRSHLPHGTVTGEAEIYRAAGFAGPRRIEVPGRVVTRVTGGIVAAVFSLSSSTPHLFGDHRAEFETELRQLAVRRLRRQCPGLAADPRRGQPSPGQRWHRREDIRGAAAFGLDTVGSGP